MRRLTLCLAALTLLAGCETIKGVGRDVTAAGETIDRAVN